MSSSLSAAELIRLLSDYQARVVPVIVKPCRWQGAPFAELQALPRDGTPIVDWQTRDHGWLDTVEGLAKVLEAGTPRPADKPVGPPTGETPPTRSFCQKMES